MNYVVKGQLATLNEHDLANRGNKFGGARLKRDMTNLVKLSIRPKKPIKNPCVISFHWHYSSKHDFDNIRFGAKYLLDGMVKAGILKNDNQKHVLGFNGDFFIKVPKGKEKVVIEVEELKT